MTFSDPFSEIAAVLAVAAAIGLKLDPHLIRSVGRVAMVTGMGQISEFSLILAALGFSLGHLDKPTIGLITLIGLITFGLSTYMILYSHWLYRWLAPTLKFFELGTRHTSNLPRDAARASLSPVDTIIFRLGRYGRNLAALYGDLEDTELFHALPLADAQWVVSTIPGRDKCLVLLPFRDEATEAASMLASRQQDEPK